MPKGVTQKTKDQRDADQLMAQLNSYHRRTFKTINRLAKSLEKRAPAKAPAAKPVKRKSRVKRKAG